MLAGWAWLSGCDSTELDPFQNDAQYFSVYGYLDPFADEQQIRVLPIRRTLEAIRSPADPHASINAEVSSEDLTTGQVTAWQHHLTPVNDTTWVHIFKARFNPLPGRRYRLVIQQANGKASSVTVQIPETPPPLEHTLIDLGPDSLMLEVRVPDISQAWRVVTGYAVQGVQGWFYFSKGNLGSPEPGGGWRFRINLTEDYRAVAALQTGSPNTPIPLAVYSVQLLFPDANWPPLRGELSLEAMAQPGRFSNVENGTGFVGALGTHFGAWDVDAALLNRLHAF